MVSQCHGAWRYWQGITGLNRRIRIQYLVVTPKGIIETKILTFSCGGKGIFTPAITGQRKPQAVAGRVDCDVKCFNLLSFAHLAEYKGV